MPGARDAAITGLAHKAVEDAVRISAVFAALGVHVPMSINMPLDILAAAAARRYSRSAQARPEELARADRRPAREVGDPRPSHRGRDVAKSLEPHNIKLALDDFGNGYNAVAKTAKLPFAEVKIGREFVTNCAVDKTKAAVCKNAIELAHKFGAAAVAVGIERGAEVLALAGMGCDGGQGFLLGQPMPETRFVSLLRLRANLPTTG